MRRNLIALLLFTCLLFSCEKKINCPGKQYYMYLAFGNNTEYEINVKLFPKIEYQLYEGEYYDPGIGGGISRTEFTMDVEEYLNIYSFDYNIYRTYDTAYKPVDLFSDIFDSVYFVIDDSLQSTLKIFPNKSININVNPFIDDSAWTIKRFDFSFYDNDCENESEIKMCKFYIKPENIEK